jgi:hypothetical protein
VNFFPQLHARTEILDVSFVVHQNRGPRGADDALVRLPGVVPRSLVFLANGALQLITRRNQIGVLSFSEKADAQGLKHFQKLWVRAVTRREFVRRQPGSPKLVKERDWP